MYFKLPTTPRDVVQTLWVSPLVDRFSTSAGFSNLTLQADSTTLKRDSGPSRYLTQVRDNLEGGGQERELPAAGGPRQGLKSTNNNSSLARASRYP